jgi:capsular polysaccharide biosynthesis protein
MEKRRVFHSMLRKWWLVVILALLGGGIGLLSVLIMQPMYKAETTLYIMNKNKVSTPAQPLDPQDLEVSRQLVLQYTDVIASRSVTSGVLDDVKNENITEKQLLSIVSITSKNNSNILTISAVWSNPAIASAIANAMGREFTTEVKKITNSDNVDILDAATVPNKPVPNNAALKILLGMMAGIIAAYGGIYIFEYFDTKARIVADFEIRLKMPVIGVIPDIRSNDGGSRDAEKNI